jgi:DNA-binding SARP family transcriptional activator/tetratricopeptide (TPR) repeat protein
VEFQILGPLAVHASGKLVPVPGTRQRRLLALLLLNANQVVPIERLVDELWDNDPPKSVRQQVHNAVATLRAALAEPGHPTPITRTDAGYALDLPDDALDVRRFHRWVRDARCAESAGQLSRSIQLLEAALALWRGDALAGLDGKTITSVAMSLNEQRLATVEKLMVQRLRTGDAGSLVGELRRLVADHPLRESLRGCLMQALYRSGRRAEALAVYDEGRRMLAEELGLDPGEHLRQLQAAILHGADDADTAPDAETESSSPPIAVSDAPTSDPGADPPRPVPFARSFLPHDIRDFSGRSAELERLLAETRGPLPRAVVISAIDGMGGVGKTTLAVHLAHRIAGDFPDGQYFIDLHGFSPGVDPVTPEQALDTLLRDGGVPPELIQHSREGRSAQWRSYLAGQRALLILDNAIDAAHVRPLLPGTAGVLVLITSRRKLSALEGAVPMSLNVLSAGDAAALFSQVAGTERVAAEPEAVAAAVELCGRLPLAIRIAAARLRDRATWSVADLVDRLRDQAKRQQFLQVGDQSVLAVLKMSYRYLQPRLQRLFRLLSLNPGPDFDAYTAAALTGYSLDVAEYCLQALFDDNLLLQTTADRFHFHDLVRDCSHQIAMEIEDPTERQATQHRLFDYYLHAVHVWSKDLENRIYNLPPRIGHQPEHLRAAASSHEAVELLSVEYRNLTAIAQFTVSNGWPAHAWQFACFLQPLLAIRNYPEGSYELFQGGVAAARAVGDVPGEAACLQGLAAVCRAHRSTAEALRHLQCALDLNRQLGDLGREAALLVDLGNVHLDDDRIDDARTAFQAAEALVEHSPNPALRAAIDNNLGVIYRDLGLYQKALSRLRKALAATPHDDRASLTAWSVGAIYHVRGEFDAALREFERILHTSTESDFEHGQAVALLGLSAVHRSLGDSDESMRLGRRALALARRLALHKLECETLIAIAETTALQDVDQAERIYQMAADHTRRHNLQRYEARVMEGFAHVASARGQHAEARRYWERAVELYPAGMADAEYARLHLAASADTATCFRCATVARSVEAAGFRSPRR